MYAAHEYKCFLYYKVHLKQTRKEKKTERKLNSNERECFVRLYILKWEWSCCHNLLAFDNEIGSKGNRFGDIWMFRWRDLSAHLNLYGVCALVFVQITDLFLKSLSKSLMRRVFEMNRNRVQFKHQKQKKKLSSKRKLYWFSRQNTKQNKNNQKGKKIKT